MIRPFFSTLQAQEFDLDRFWIMSLLLSSLTLLVWVGWATMGSILLYEDSAAVELTARADRNHALVQAGNVYRVRNWQQHFLEARFPRSSHEKLLVGQSALVFVRDGADERAVAAVVTEISDDGEQNPIRVTLRADVLEDAPDPFSHANPSHVRVVVGTLRPIALLMSGWAGASRPDTPK